MPFLLLRHKQFLPCTLHNDALFHCSSRLALQCSYAEPYQAHQVQDETACHHFELSYRASLQQTPLHSKRPDQDLLSVLITTVFVSQIKG